MKDLISKVFEEKMQDGTLEKIVSEKIDEMVRKICSDQMGYGGAAKKAMEEKLNPLILQAVERCDLSDMVTKITMLLNASLKGSEVEQYHDLIESAQNLFGANDSIKALREKRVVKLSKIFEEYQKYLQYIYDRDDFESYDIEEGDYGPFASVECALTVAPDDSAYVWNKPGYEVELSTTKSDDKKSGDIRFKLKWNYDNTELRLCADFRSLSLADLRYCPPFIIYLATIEREWIKVEVDTEEEDDIVYINFERE